MYDNADRFLQDKVLIDDRRIHVDFSQSVSKLQMDSLKGTSKSFEHYGEGLEKKQRYRGVKESYHEKYELLFDQPSSRNRFKQPGDYRDKRRESNIKRDRERNKYERENRYGSRHGHDSEYDRKDRGSIRRDRNRDE